MNSAKPDSTYLESFRTICQTGQIVAPLGIRLAQREICGFGDYALETFGLMVAMFIVGVAWQTFLLPKAGE